jgi:hypothetical protein
MAERVLTEPELNRALLARQLLLERTDLPIPRALERVGGIQAQYAPSSYVGLWSRLAAFKREDLTRALERRSVVQGTLMRVTIHLVSARDYPLLTAGVKEARRASWTKARRGLDPRKVEAAARRVRSLLGSNPRSRSELVEALGVDSQVWNGVGMWIDLLRVPPSGTWERRRADLYALADEWISFEDASPEEGYEHLLRRYLGAFGPAALKDAANWAGPRLRARARRGENGVATLPGRVRRRAARSAAGPATRRRHPGAAPLPALVGRGDACPCAASADPSRRVSSASLSTRRLHIRRRRS